MFGVHPVFLIILLVIVLIIFGPGRLPELGGAIGKGLREFRKASDEIREEVMRPAADEHTSTTTTASSSTPEPPKPEPPKPEPKQS